MDTISSNDPLSNPQFYIIYSLVDPRDYLPRYVGFTTNPERRMLKHKYELNGQNPEKETWIEELKRSGLEAIFQPLEVVKGLTEAREREIYWVRYYLKKGITLTNILIARTSYTLFPHVLKPESPSSDPDKHVSYQFQYRKCGKPHCVCVSGEFPHGPYWYAFWRENGKVHSRYIGKA